MLSVAGLTKSLGSVARGTSMSRTSRAIKPVQKRNVSSVKIVAGAKRTAVVVPKFEEKIGLVHARLYTTDVASKTKKKRKGFSTAAFREFFGKSSSEQLNKTSQKVPVAPKVSHRLVVHNQALRDDYHYMTQIMSDQAAQEYFALEDTYAQKKTTTELSQYAKVFGREIESLDTSHQMAPAEQVGEYFYYARQEKGRQMAVYCRKKGINGAEEILFDGNAELSKHNQMFLATMKVNIDQSVLLKLIDTGASEVYEVHVRDLVSGRDLPVEITGICNVEWAPDGKSFFYTEPDTKRRPAKVYKHVLGTPRSQDVLIFEEADEQHFVDVARTKDGKYITINSNSKTTSEIFVFDPSTSTTPTRVFSRDLKTEFFLEHSVDGFYMITTDGAESNYKVLRCDDKDIQNMAAWKEFVPASADVKIDDIDVFTTHVVLYERHQGVAKLRVINKKTSQSQYIPVPSDIGHVEPGSNLDANTKSFRFTFSSPLVAGISYDYILETGELKEVGRIELPRAEGARAAFDPADYTVRRVMVPSAGGVSVPLTLVHRKDIQPSGDNPTLINAYGAYGHTLDTGFDVSNLPLLQRGWCIAYAHVRGGGDLGLKWHHTGRLMQKRNTFDDLANCAQWLFDERLTSGNWLVGRGASAGGLPFAVAANEHPGMFKALVLKNPFLDVVTTMLDDTLPLTVHEYDEWGNPHKKEVFDYLYSWDPYWNMRAQEYPHMYITSSILDVRVPCSNQVRYVAKLRTIKTDKNQILLNVDSNFGHFGDSSTSGFASAAGKELSFIYASLNVVPDRI